MVCLNLKQNDYLERQIKNEVERNKTKNSNHICGKQKHLAKAGCFCYNFYMNQKKKIVGILRGGSGDFYKSSVDIGSDFFAHILKDLSDKWKPLDILIDKKEIWHINGLPIKPIDLIHRVDVVWNFSHPKYSNILKGFKIPVVGEDYFSYGMKNSREMLKEHMKQIGVEMPKHFLLPKYQEDMDGLKEEYSIKKAKEVLQKFPAPWIVRSLAVDKDMGVHVAKTFPELVSAIEDCINHNESILVEELITGKNAFTHNVSNFRGKDIYTFPVGNFSKNEKEKLDTLSKDIHQHIGVFQYLKSNFIVSPNRGIFLTSIEFFPDLREVAHFDKICKSVGAKKEHVIEHILESVL